MGKPGIPAAFKVVDAAAGRLIVHEQLQEAFTRAGFAEASAWERCLGSGSGQSGRGGSAVREFGGITLRLKQLRRGGQAARFLGEYFSDEGRLLENLSVPIEVAIRGIVTAAPRALLIETVAGSGYRGWLATEELPAMRDAAALVREGPQRADPQWLPAMSIVRRMHDVGIEHRDLNLGNLMIGVETRGAVAIIDFDHARLHNGPLSFRRRQWALRRLERSYVKLCHPQSAAEATRTQIYSRYAGDDLSLTRRLRRGRRVGRWGIALHRLGWPAG